MKKVLSVVLSLVMLTSCFAIGSFDAFASTKKDVATVTAGELITFTAQPLDSDKFFELESYENTDCYIAKFVPTATGYYDFKFSTKYAGATEDDMLMTAIVDDKEEAINMAMCMEYDKEFAEIYEMLGITNDPSVAAQLTANKPYYLLVFNLGTKPYTSNVTIGGHTHSFASGKYESYVDSESLKYNEDGETYTHCTSNNCDYYKKTSTIYKVKSVSLSKSSYTYNKETKKPAVTVKDSKGKVLKKGTDYTVKYKSNKSVGTAKAVITFKGNYEGSYTKTFKINPKGTSLSSVSAKSKGFTVNWKKQTTQTTGYQIQYATDKNFTKNKKTVTVSKNKTTSKTVSKLKGKKKYYVRVRTYKTVDKKKYYSGWSKAKTVTTKK